MVTSVIWIVVPATLTAPQSELVCPGAKPVVDGEEKPEGTVRVISPSFVPPVAAV